MWQHTVANEVYFEGIGVHSGAMGSVRLFPAPPGAGIRLRNSKHPGDDIIIGRCIPERQPGATVLKARHWAAWTIEHLMAALSVAGVDNVVIEFTGSEVPILDGSARPFFDEIQRVGLCKQEARRQRIAPIDELVFSEGGKEGRGRRFLHIAPHSDSTQAGLNILYTASFEHALLGERMVQSLVPILHNSTDCDQGSNLLSARTFGFLEHLPALQKMGLARGSSLENTLVIAGDNFMNQPRFDHEWVWHKALDLVGDLALLGRPLVASVEASCTGHAFHRQIIEHAIQKPHCWQLLD